eukprot:6476977-Pyramimonas_sp.AAC.4
MALSNRPACCYLAVVGAAARGVGAVGCGGGGGCGCGRPPQRAKAGGLLRVRTALRVPHRHTGGQVLAAHSAPASQRCGGRSPGL